MGHAIEYIYENDGYPFLYVSLVDDMVSSAYARVYTVFNLQAHPTIFFDGGYQVQVGGYESLSYYRPKIEASGARPVNDVDLTFSMTWLGNGQVQLDYSLVCHDFFNDGPTDPTPATLETIGSTHIKYDFVTTASDPEGDDIYYRYNFNDGTITDWLGPYTSGDTCMISYTWLYPGEYTVLTQAKDIYDNESDWVESANEISLIDYIPGDPNRDFIRNIIDIVYLINFLYKSGPAPNPYASGDANGTVTINIIDIVYMIEFLYKGGPAPVYP
ncbi:MAG: hypothetical protein ABIJ12_07695 [bacterium]